MAKHYTLVQCEGKVGCAMWLWGFVGTLGYAGKKQGVVMDWATRVKVAVGAARGLAYLHEDCNPRIIHRDIKASNILLDKNFDAQVCCLRNQCGSYQLHVLSKTQSKQGCSEDIKN